MKETVFLREIAYARSGDKGSNANIGIIARTEEAYAFLLRELTAERVEIYFSNLGASSVERFELANLGALNFLLKGVLAGGGSSSLRIDSQGKTLGQALLEMPLEISKKELSICHPK